MINRMQRFSRASVMVALVITFVAASPVNQRTQAGQARASSSQAQTSEIKKALDLGLFYYNNDDITDRAAIQFRKARDRSPRSSEGATAQYYLASYYHRKFYVQKEKTLREDIGLLVKAQAEYEDYVSRYAWNTQKPQWLSDAYFNLALLFAQRGDSLKTEEYLGKMYGAAPSDEKVYIYQVVWSRSPKDVVDAFVDAKALAEFANSRVYNERALQLQKSQPPSFSYFVERIRQWCVSQKSSSAN